jgi:drug/metabolite transporter (DMT)-like permease
VTPRTSTSRSAFGNAALAAAVLVWGSTFVVTKGLLDEFGPFTIAFVRFGLAFLLLLPLAHRTGYHYRASLTPGFLRFGLFGVTLFFGLQNLGLVFTTAGSAALIMVLIPATTAMLAAVALGERLSLRQLVGVALSIIGAGLVVQSGLALGESRALLGNLLVLGSVLAWAAYTVQGRVFARTVPTIVATTAGIGSGTLLLAPAALIEIGVTGLPAVSLTGLAGLAYLAFAASGLTLFLWNYGLRSIAASSASVYTNLIPVTGLLFAVLVGEAVTAVQLAGGAVAGAGVALSQHGSRQPDADPEAPSGRTANPRGAGESES